MSTFYLSMALILLLSIVTGLYRILRGPTAADRMLAAQLFGTCGVAMMLLLAKGLNQPVIEDIALVYGLLGVLSVVAFVQRAWSSTVDEQIPESGGGADDD
ncbi:MAG: monovalent cation/H+ antiporter complex subunit F [Desulfobulbaceae bacterium]|nr:monovalent cation/H+ antiporter complex subunit F [Desulfobulbaceae bacterium]